MRPFLIGAAGGAALGGGAVYAYIQRRGDESPASSKPATMESAESHPAMRMGWPTGTEDTLRVFEVPPGVFVKMHVGTWHAGPLFRCDDDVGTHIDFYNLELADTNVVDHNTHDYATADGIEFEVVER